MTSRSTWAWVMGGMGTEVLEGMGAAEVLGGWGAEEISAALLLPCSLVTCDL